MIKIMRLLSPLVVCAAMQATTLGPSGSLTVGSNVTNFSLSPVEGTKLSQLMLNVQGSNWSVNGQATVNPDPFIDYGFAIKNFGASPLNFVIVLSTPFIGGEYDFAKSSHSGSITDSSGVTPANGSAVVVAAVGGLHQPSVDGNPFGAIEGGCSVAGAPPGDSFPCGLGNENGIAIDTNATGILSIRLAGSVSAGDVYTFNGLASIYNIPSDTEIPEPATAGLALVAFGAAAVIRRRMAA